MYCSPSGIRYNTIDPGSVPLVGIACGLQRSIRSFDDIFVVSSREQILDLCSRPQIADIFPGRSGWVKFMRSAKHAFLDFNLEPKWRSESRRDRAYADSLDHHIRLSAKLDPRSCDLDPYLDPRGRLIGCDNGMS